MTAWKTKKIDLKNWTRRQKKTAAVAALIVVAAGWGLFGGDQGLIALVASQREAWLLKKQIKTLTLENQQLQDKAASLTSDDAYFEKTAREKLLLKKPDELVYRFDKK